MGNTIDLAQYKYTLTLDSGSYDKSMTNAEQTAESMKTKLSGIGTFLKTTFATGLAAVGAAIAGTVTEGVKSYADLEEQMSSFKSTTGASADEVAKVQQIAQQLYKTNTDSMEDIVSTAAEMKTKMGLTADQIGSLQQKVMDFAKTTGSSNTDVVDSVDKIGDAWGLSADQSVGYLDVLKKSSEEYGTDVSAVTSALAQAAPASKALGLSLDQTNGIMNLFATSGLDSSQAITALTYAAKQVKSPEEFQKMLSDIEAIADPTERAQKAVELFGARAGVALSNAFDGNKSLQDFVLTTKDCTGAVSDASEAFDSNFNVQLQLAKKQFSGLAMEIGGKVMPVINNVLSWVTTNMPTIVGTVEKVINGISKFFSPLANAIKSFIDLVSEIWNKWGDSITAKTSTVWNGISAVIGSVVNIISGVINVFTALVSGDWKGFLDGLLDIAKNAWDLIKNLFETVAEILGTILSVAFTAMKTVVLGIFKGMWEGLKAIFSSIQEWFQGAWNGLVTWLIGLTSKFYNAATTIFNSLWNGLKEIWSSISSWVSEVWDGAVTTITGFGTRLFDAGKSLFTSLWDGIRNIWDSISSWVSEKVAWIADKLSFWNSANAAMSSDKSMTKTTTMVNGSHANGLNYVPFDNYVALLHRGERVLTAEQNAAYNTQNTTNSNQTVNIGDIHVHEVDNGESLAKAIIRRFPSAMLQAQYKRR